MAVTNYLVSSLPAYVEQSRDLIIKNFALAGAGTRGRIGLRTGVKSGVKIPYLDFTLALQDGSGCAFNPLDEAEIAQIDIAVKAIKHDGQLCPETLLGTYAEYLVRINATENDLPYEAYLMDAMTREVNKTIEKLIWQGDTANGTGNMAVADGFLVLLAADGNVLTENIASGATAYAGLRQVYGSMPDEALERGGLIFVAPAIFRALISDMLNMGFMNVAAAPQDEVILPGTDVRVIKTPGLIGDLNVVATFGDNLVYATDVEGDETDVDLWWSQDDRIFKWQVKWTQGVGYFFPDQIVLGTFAATPTASTPIATAVAGIAECVCAGGE